MASFPIGIRFEPVLSVEKLNVILEQLKASLGSLGQDIKPIDTAALAASLKKIDEAVGGANEHAEKLQEGFKGVEESVGGAVSKSSLFQKAFEFNQIQQSIQALSNTFQQLSGSFIEYEASLKEIKAITGVADDVIADLGERAKDLAKTFGGEVTAQLDAFKGVLSRFGPDIAKSPEVLNSMATSINLLSKAGGIDATASMDALTNSALQFGVDLSDPIAAAAKLAEMTNTLAASAQVGAAEIPQVAQAVVVAGAAAKGANISFEETNGAIQVLAAASGKYGSEAGTSLRNVVGLLQKNSNEAHELTAKLGIPFEQLGQTLTSQGLGPALGLLNEGLQKLGSDAEKNAAIMQIFGTENAAAASSLLGNTEMLAKFTQGVTGTSSAVDQAAINMDTTGAALDRLKAKVEVTLIEGFNKVGSSVTLGMNAMAQVAPTLTSIGQLKAIIPDSAFASIGKFTTSFKNIVSSEAVSRFNSARETITKMIPSSAITLASSLSSKLGSMGSGALERVGGLAQSMFKTLIPALGSTTAAQTGLNVAMLANPIGATIALVVALGAVFALLYNKVQPFKEFIDSKIKFLEDAFAKAQPVISKVGDVLGLVGSIIINQLLLPFNVIGTVIGTVFSKLSGGAGTSATALSAIGSVFDWIGDKLNYVKAGLEGFVAFIGGIAGTIAKLVTFDFSGAVDSLKSGFQGAIDTATQSLQTSRVADASKKIGDVMKENVEANAKNAKVDMAPLLSQYETAQKRIAEIQAKGSKRGFALDSEKAELESLQKSTQNTIAKIGELSPQAAKVVGVQLDAQGKMQQVYDLNIAKAKEFADAQKKGFDGETKTRAERYSGELLKITSVYNDQKKTLEGMKGKLAEAMQSGDKSKIDEAQKAFNDLKAKVDDNGAAMKKAFEDGAKAGLLTEDALKQVAAAQGITVDQAKSNILKDSFELAAKTGALTVDVVKDMAKQYGVTEDVAKRQALSIEMKRVAESGAGSKEVIARLAEKYGVSKEEAQKLFAEQEKLTKEAKSTTDQVKSLGDQYEATLKKAKEGSEKNVAELKGLYTQLSEQRIKGDAAGQKATKERIDQLVEETKVQAHKLKADKDLEKSIRDSTGLSEEKKKKGKSAAEEALKNYQAEAELIDHVAKKKEKDYEFDVLVNQKRSLNKFDDIEKGKLEAKAIDDKISRMKELLKLTADDKGRITIGVKHNKDDVDKIQKEFDKLTEKRDDLASKALVIRTKLDASHDELQDQFRVQVGKLEVAIELAIREGADKASINKLYDEMLALELAHAQEFEQRIAEKQKLLDAETNEGKKEALRQSIKELMKIERDAEKDYSKDRKKIFDDRLKQIEAETKAKLDEEAKYYKEQQKLIDDMENLTVTAGKSALVVRKEQELKDLEDLKKQHLVSEDDFNQRKKALEEKAADEELVMQALSNGRKIEAERDMTVRLAQTTIEQLEIRKQAAVAAGNYNEVKKIESQLDENRKVLDEKGSLLTVAATDLQSGLTSIIGNLVQGDTDGAKKSMKGTLAQIAGYLQKLASAAAVRLVLGSEPALALVAAAGPFLGPAFIASFTALINQAVNALMSPVLSGLLSFSTGAIVTEPTLAIVGDRANTSGRDNTEMILGSDQMRAALQQAFEQYDSVVAAEVRLLREDLRNQLVVVSVDGQEMLTAVRLAESREQRRLQTG